MEIARDRDAAREKERYSKRWIARDRERERE